jgi:uncharacterized membrane protein (UPF0127 family)
MRSSNRRKLIVAVAAAVALGFVGPATAQPQTFQTYEKVPLEIRSAKGAHRFTVELARTPDQQMQGLMFRRKLDADAGMLFVYQEPVVARYWMKNTYIPLDMIFIAPDGHISSIAERTVPLSLATISSDVPVIAVLELNGGTASRLGIKIGDKVIQAAIGTPG